MICRARHSRRDCGCLRCNQILFRFSTYRVWAIPQDHFLVGRVESRSALLPQNFLSVQTQWELSFQCVSDSDFIIVLPELWLSVHHWIVRTHWWMFKDHRRLIFGLGTGELSSATLLVLCLLHVPVGVVMPWFHHPERAGLDGATASLSVVVP